MGPLATDQGPAPRLDAPALRRWLSLATGIAERSRNLVDSLNVFPIPDADTGTNVLLTLRSALDAVALLPPGADAAQTSRAIADGAIRGARGNSGLLVSQALAALAETCASAPDPAGLRPVELVHALEQMASSTWSAVSRPVTGTLLTVAADAASSARDALASAGPQQPATPVLIAIAAALGAQESVVETGGLGHGPVDAGGAALMLLLTSLADTLDTVSLPVGPGPAPSPATDVALQMLTDLAAGGATHQGAGADAEGMSTGEFEVMYLLEATSAQAERLRATLECIGDSVGVVGTPDALGVGLFQVHVHTDTPRAALPKTGRARQICVHHLHATPLIAPADEPPAPWLEAGGGDSHVVSFERLAARRARRSASGPAPRTTPRIGVIACTRAPGLIEQLARAGAAVVLDPRREGISRAAGDLGADEVIVLPCDDAATTAAHEAARALAARAASAPGGGEGTHLTIGDTDDEAQVLAATVALAGQAERDDAQIGDLARRAWRAAAHVRTTALSGAAAEPDAVARAVAASLRADDEILTVILGRSALPDVGFMAREAAARPTGAVTDPYGGEGDGGADALEVIVLAGDQPTPDVLLAFE